MSRTTQNKITNKGDLAVLWSCEVEGENFKSELSW